MSGTRACVSDEAIAALLASLPKPPWSLPMTRAVQSVRAALAAGDRPCLCNVYERANTELHGKVVALQADVARLASAAHPHGTEREALLQALFLPAPRAATPVASGVEHIDAAAVRYQSKVWWLMWPCRHCHVFQMIAQALDVDRVEGCEQGFRTSTGRFVGRIEGGELAIAAGQIKALKWPPYLYSEDLW